MKSAAFGSRPVGVLLFLTMAALVLSVVPSSAQASTVSMDINPCLGGSYYMMMMLGPSNDEDDKKLDECEPATNGLFPMFNINLVRPIMDMLNSYFGNHNVGGPPAAYRRADNNEAKRAELARWIDRQSGTGMPAGVTPRETTGEAIQRWIQPLRDSQVNGWFNTTWSSPRDDHRPTRYDSDIWTLTMGADMPMLVDGLLVGIFGSFTNSDVDSTFNNGGVESKLGTIGPYFSYTLNEFLAFDVTVAGVFGQHENTVGAPPATTPLGMGSSPKARGEQDVDGFFISMNANGNYWIGNWGVQGRLGFLHSDMETDSFALASGGASVRIPSRNNEITQISLATQINYFMAQGLPYCEAVKALPFFRITWNYDLDHDNIQLPFGVPQHPNDDDEVVLGWGVSLFGNGPFSGSLEAGRTVARKEFESWMVSGTVSYAF